MVHGQSGGANRIDHASVLRGGDISEAAIFDEDLRVLFTADEYGAGGDTCTDMLEDAIGDVQRSRLRELNELLEEYDRADVCIDV